MGLYNHLHLAYRKAALQLQPSRGTT